MKKKSEPKTDKQIMAELLKAGEKLKARLKLDEEVLQEIWDILNDGGEWSTEDLGYISGALDRWKKGPE